VRVPFPRRRPARVALALAAVLVAVVLFWWRGPELALLQDAFTAVHLRWVIAAIGLNLLSVFARTIAWQAVINEAMPPPRPRFRSVFSAFCVGLLGNAVLPGRIGEVARVAVLARRLPRGRGAWATLAGTVVAHRVFDVVAISLLVLYVLAEARIPAWAISSLAGFVALGLTALAIAVVSARRHQASVLDGLGPVRRLVQMARHGLGVMRAPGPAALAAVMQIVGWTYQLLAVYATMRAFQIEEPLVAAGLVLVLMNVATIFPLWPGNVGLVQAAVALPLVSYGIDYAHGFAFGIGLQAVEASVGVALGLAFLAREGLSMAMLRALPEGDEADAADEPLSRSLARRREQRARARVPG
jgi:glycosyltransferase 2 family protein